MNKRRYITPTMRWVWIGMDEKVAQNGNVAVVGSGVNDTELPPEPGFVKENESWTEDTWASASSGGVWDNAW